MHVIMDTLDAGDPESDALRKGLQHQSLVRSCYGSLHYNASNLSVSCMTNVSEGKQGTHVL